MPGGKKKGRKPAVEIDLVQLELYAALQLSVPEIAACIGIAENTFYKYQKTKPAFKEALRRGRSKAVAKCAQFVLENCSDKKAPGKDGAEGKVIRSGDPRLALEYLKIHGDNWKTKPVDVRHSGQIDGNVNVQIPQLEPETAKRMARAYLQIHGDDIQP